jgi:NAD(P)-dependent dehydrogenase (short-subunit alcohol dehydrogenase family)
MALDDYATKDGYDVQMQTNHLSHFLLTKELYPLLKRARDLRGEARVVHHTSEARRLPSTPLSGEYYEKKGGNLGGNAAGQNVDGPGMFFNGPRWERYHQSKLANTVFTLALKDRFGNSGIKAACAAPGLSATNLQVTTLQSGGMEASQANMLVGMYHSAEDGSMPILTACFDPSTENGDLFEPADVWTGPTAKVEYDEFSLDPQSRKVLWELSEAACGKFEIS